MKLPINLNNLTEKQFDVVKESELLSSENAFWLFMAMQSAIFNSPNSSTVQYQIDTLVQKYSDLFDRYYNENDASIFRVNLSGFFDAYIAYLNSRANKETQMYENLLTQWKDKGDVIAKNFASVNPYWKESEWRGMIGNQINILDQEIKNNSQGIYSTLADSYNIFNRVMDDIAIYLASGLIEQFAI